MSFVSENTRRAILDFLLRRISDEQFYIRAQVEPGHGGAFALTMLRRGLVERDADGAALGLSLGHRFGISADYLDPLFRLAGEGWHKCHEDVVSGLDSLRAPEAVEVLFRTATVKHPYLAYDEAYALGTKCIYALAHLETAESTKRLADLLCCGNPVLEAEAAARLRNLAREGKSEETRVAASEALAARGLEADDSTEDDE